MDKLKCLPVPEPSSYYCCSAGDIGSVAPLSSYEYGCQWNTVSDSKSEFERGCTQAAAGLQCLDCAGLEILLVVVEVVHTAVSGDSGSESDRRLGVGLDVG